MQVTPRSQETRESDVSHTCLPLQLKAGMMVFKKKWTLKLPSLIAIAHWCYGNSTVKSLQFNGFCSVLLFGFTQTVWATRLIAPCSENSKAKGAIPKDAVARCCSGRPPTAGELQQEFCYCSSNGEA